MIHDSSLRNRAVALPNGHAEPRDPEAYLNSTSREQVASCPPKARRSSEFAIAAEVLKNHAGQPWAFPSLRYDCYGALSPMAAAALRPLSGVGYSDT